MALFSEDSLQLYDTYRHEAPVWFVGAGPGDPDLITVKGQRLIALADLVLYSGSLVPPELVACAKETALVVDSANMTLHETHALIQKAAKEGKLVARVHTGDAGIYGAMREQKQLLDKDGITSRVIPGITAAFAAAAAAQASFTVPESVQSLVITRLGGRTPVPQGQHVSDYAALTGAMAIYLSAQSPEQIANELKKGGVSGDTAILIAHRVSWPDQLLVWSTLDTLVEDVSRAGIRRQAVFLVLPGEKDGCGAVSRLYAEDFSHGYRQAKK